MPYDDYDFVEIYGLTPAQKASQLVRDYGLGKAMKRVRDYGVITEQYSQLLDIVHVIRFKKFWEATREELGKL